MLTSVEHGGLSASRFEAPIPDLPGLQDKVSGHFCSVYTELGERTRPHEEDRMSCGWAAQIKYVTSWVYAGQCVCMRPSRVYKAPTYLNIAGIDERFDGVRWWWSKYYSRAQV